MGTVRFRVPSVIRRCLDMVEINTPLESPWSTKLISVIFDYNKAIFDELELVIDSAARSVNRIL